MIKRSLKEIQEMVNGRGLDSKYENNVIEQVIIDSRKVVKGSLFIPIAGENFNGHRFAAQALLDGAGAALWSEKEKNPPQNKPVIFVEDTLKALQLLAQNYKEQLQVKVVGVTGSNGKTTTKDLIASVLSTAYQVHKTKGNFNNHIGLPLTLLAMPESVDIAVLEMGMSSKGEIELLSKLAKPDIAVITNIGESHLMDLGSREGIADAKLEIVSGLNSSGELIYIGDEPLLQERVKDLPFKKTTFGDGDRNDLYPDEILQKTGGTSFKVNGSEYSIPILGKHNVYNALAAIAAAKHFGLSEEKIREGLSCLEMTGMRLEMTKTESGLSIINDAYNASPTSMKAAVKLMEDLDGYIKKVVVLGDMLELGDHEEFFHTEVGREINHTAIDYVYTFGKLGAYIANGALKNFLPEKVKHYEDKQELIADLKQTAGKGDLILVKASRGMRLEEVVEGLK
ncbi:UDP-N-acetylmuramoyl-tripeptide--D-alanyl-D-alanine ligase [Metabacillus arenae]|uniref:UDP-N-acetylmuramoyl-tripeptide--D-alanyl-D-alanine ligase n=1 Tax=Metabacillus arenae TaxID=2771434 RepID=A0A926RZE2_9BACI|nr:UDP-N-acetylmuramoyl-tripeptide--D-alanyl-D-alanine ligase [Metabacillus arenae]MBD1382157.1 UDP-N-acetylmuramoyl-tripeptide--D-alanyl-D-alanine ligase [Metabacillus arenae]